MTLKEVIKGTQKKKTENTAGFKNVFAHFVWKTISYFVTWPLVNTKVTPNQVSFVSLLAPIIGTGIFMVADTVPLKILAVVFFAIWAVLDDVDGGSARLKQHFSKNGDLWDSAAGYVALSLMFVGMGFAAFDETDPNTVYYVVLGGLGGILALYPRLLMHFKYHGEDNVVNDKTSYGPIKLIVFNVISPDGFMIPFMFVGVIFGLEWFFTIGYTALYFLACVYSTWLLFRE